MLSSKHTITTHNPTLLFIVRIVTWLIIAASLLMIAINIGVFYAYILEHAAALAWVSSPHVIAIIRSIIRRFGELIYLGMAVTIAVRSKDPSGLLMACLLAALGASIGGAYIENAAYVEGGLLAIMALVTVIPGTLGPLLLLSIPHRIIQPGWLRWAMLILAFTEPVRFISQKSPLFFPSWVPLAAVIPLAFFIAWGVQRQLEQYQQATVVNRQQYKWIAYGAAILIVCLLGLYISYLVVPPGFHVLTAGLDEVGGVVFALTMAFALGRYRLYDIDVFINRSLVYIGLFISLCTVFGAVLLGIQWLLPSLNPGVATAIGVLLVLPLFFPIRTRLQRWIDQRIYGFRYDLNELRRVPNSRFDWYRWHGGGISWLSRWTTGSHQSIGTQPGRNHTNYTELCSRGRLAGINAAPKRGAQAGCRKKQRAALPRT